MIETAKRRAPAFEIEPEFTREPPSSSETACKTAPQEVIEPRFRRAPSQESALTTTTRKQRIGPPAPCAMARGKKSAGQTLATSEPKAPTESEYLSAPQPTNEPPNVREPPYKSSQSQRWPLATNILSEPCCVSVPFKEIEPNCERAPYRESESAHERAPHQ